MANSPIKLWTRLLGSALDDQSNFLITGRDGSIYLTGSTGGSVDGQPYAGGQFDALVSKYSTEGVKLWTRLIGASGQQVAYGLTEGLDGSIYVGGYTLTSLDGQAITGINSDGFLTKFSPDGVKIWTRLIGTKGSEEVKALTTGLDGSIYLTGFTWNTANGGIALDGNPSNTNLSGFISKYNVDGTSVWTRLISGNKSVYGEAITTGRDGSLFISGYTSGSIDGQTFNGGLFDAFVTKYSSSGVKAWTRLIGTSEDDVARRVTTGLDGAVYVLGTTDSSIDGQKNSYKGWLDVFVTKFDTGGNKIWTRMVGTYNHEFAGGISTGIDGSIFISGTSLQVSGIPLAVFPYDTLDNQIKPGGNDSFIMKFDTNGNRIWTQILGTSATDGSSSLAIGLDGSLYVTGTVYGTSGLSLDGQTHNGNVSAGNFDIYLTKYSVTPSYSLFATAKNINEGSTVQFKITSTNVAAGTRVPYTISGVSSLDVSGGFYDFYVVIDSEGNATISVILLNDKLTEGVETLYINLEGNIASVIVNDTSTAPIPTNEKNEIAIIIDKNIMPGGAPVYLKGLVENLIYSNGVVINHTIELDGTAYVYSQVDRLITTVTRNGEFTPEFTKEINDYLQTNANITYKAAVAIVGIQSIDGAILSVAGADGDFVN